MQIIFEKRAKGKGQSAKSKGQRGKIKEQGAKGKKIRAKGQGAVSQKKKLRKGKSLVAGRMENSGQ